MDQLKGQRRCEDDGAGRRTRRDARLRLSPVREINLSGHPPHSVRHRVDKEKTWNSTLIAHQLHVRSRGPQTNGAREAQQAPVFGVARTTRAASMARVLNVRGWR
jgi:hypothetical protein